VRGLARALYSLHKDKDATTPTLTHGPQVGLSHSTAGPSTAITDPRWQRRLDEHGSPASCHARIARGAREWLDVSVRSSPAWRVIDGGGCYWKMHVRCCSMPSRLMGSIESSSLVRFPERRRGSGRSR
jgi:hypothetical protein